MKHSSSQLTLTDIIIVLTSLVIFYQQIFQLFIPDMFFLSACVIQETILTSQLLHTNPEQRIQTLQAVQSHPFMANLHLDKVKDKAIKPLFVPSVSV